MADINTPHKEIPLTKGKVALVDAEDYELLSRYKWYANRSRNKWYAYRTVWQTGQFQRIPLHRFILNPPTHLEIDHIDGDGLNCVRSNMRLATTAQNQANRGPQSNNTSGYKGVVKREYGWEASIQKDGKRHSLGYYHTSEDAARAYDKTARVFFGDFAYLNFPEEGNPL